MKSISGMRLFKTGLAVTVTLALAKPLGMAYPFFAAIATIISMENTIANSFKAGKNRLKGTLLGATTGLLFALVAQGNPILAGVGIMAVIWFCHKMDWKNAIAISCIVFLAVMVNLDGENPLIYSLNRLEDTFVGVSVAILVNYFVFPFNNETVIRRTFKESIEMIDLYIERSETLGLTRVTKEGLLDYHGSVQNFKEQLGLYEEEYWLFRAHQLEMRELWQLHDLLENLGRHLSVLYDIENEDVGVERSVWQYHIEGLKNTRSEILQKRIEP